MPKTPEVILFKYRPLEKADGNYKRRIKVKPETILSKIDSDYCYLTLINLDSKNKTPSLSADVLSHEFIHFLQMKFGLKMWKKPEELMAYLSGSIMEAIYKCFYDFYSNESRQDKKSFYHTENL